MNVFNVCRNTEPKFTEVTTLFRTCHPGQCRDDEAYECYVNSTYTLEIVQCFTKYIL